MFSYSAIISLFWEMYSVSLSGKLKHLSNVSYGRVTGEVRTFLEEGSDTSKNFPVGVLAKFRVILVRENLLWEILSQPKPSREKRKTSFPFLS